MILPLNLAAAVASSNEEDLRPGLDPASVTPGTLGFIFTLLIVVAVIFLIRDMTKRIRRVRYNATLQDGGLDAGPAQGRNGVATATPEAGAHPGPAQGTGDSTTTAPDAAPGSSSSPTPGRDGQ